MQGFVLGVWTTFFKSDVFKFEINSIDLLEKGANAIRKSARFRASPLPIYSVIYETIESELKCEKCSFENLRSVAK